MTDNQPPEDIYVQHYDGVFVHQPPRERCELCADDHELSDYCQRNGFVKYIRADTAEAKLEAIGLYQIAKIREYLDLYTTDLTDLAEAVREKFIAAKGE